MTAPLIDPAATADPTGNALAAGSAAAADPSAAAAVVPVVPVPAALAVPETYTLTLPQGSLLATTALERVTTAAKGLKLTQDADAQALVGLAEAEVKEAMVAWEAARQPGGTIHTAQVQQQTAAALAHPALGNGDPALLERKTLQASLVLNRFPAGRELVGILNASGDAQRPEVLRFLNEIHDVMSEKALVLPGDVRPVTTASLASRFFGDGPKPATAVPVR